MPPRKDPNKPKGRTSAYAFFVQDRREKSKERGEQVQFAEFSRECADKWKVMEKDDKTKYNALAEKDKARYVKQMATYQPINDEDGGKRRRRKKKDPNMPKRSM